MSGHQRASRPGMGCWEPVVEYGHQVGRSASISDLCSLCTF